jgi:hypothetical protein
VTCAVARASLLYRRNDTICCKGVSGALPAMADVRTIAHCGCGKVKSAFANGASQFSNAAPREAPSRQIRRHLRIVRKLSKDKSKFRGRTGKSSARIPAPTFVISVTLHDRTPIWSPRNSTAPLSILVLAVDLRSFIAITRALNELLIPDGAHPPHLLENSNEWWSVLPPAKPRGCQAP